MHKEITGVSKNILITILVAIFAVPSLLLVAQDPSVLWPFAK